MKFTIQNTILMKHLQKINRLLIKNISLPILENILFEINDGILSLTASNLEIELISNIIINTHYEPGKITISGRKILDICRNIPKYSNITMELKKNKMYINSNSISYILATLASDNFPKKKQFQCISEFFINSSILKNMITKTEFAMGKQDVRHYLNGMLFTKKNETLYSISTDGYRLALSNTTIQKKIIDFSIIIPRKGIIELSRLLNIESEPVHIIIGNNNIRLHIKKLIFTAQLIDGKYPDYNSVLLKKLDNPIIFDTFLLKESLSRVSILSHEKFHGIDIYIHNGKCKVMSYNQEEEIAEDTFKINYYNDKIEFSINVYYILDILNVIKNKNIILFVNLSQSSIQIIEENNTSSLYVIMLLKR
ncbi:DNA polymerase III subunit beta [Buchnera aphidicola]|uniref:DNA polymerase III subunit beta n=1 Tax=Buchnera aphidicola TaxID=9 RepID=UPI003BEF0F35